MPEKQTTTIIELLDIYNHISISIRKYANYSFTLFEPFCFWNYQTTFQNIFQPEKFKYL